jgi:hypothetical protein
MRARRNQQPAPATAGVHQDDSVAQHQPEVAAARATVHIAGLEHWLRRARSATEAVPSAEGLTSD